MSVYKDTYVCSLCKYKDDWSSYTLSHKCRTCINRINPSDLDSVIKSEGLLTRDEHEKELKIANDRWKRAKYKLENKIEGLYTAEEACDVAIEAILVGSVVAEYPNLIRKAFGVKEGER